MVLDETEFAMLLGKMRNGILPSNTDIDSLEETHDKIKEELHCSLVIQRSLTKLNHSLTMAILDSIIGGGPE